MLGGLLKVSGLLILKLVYGKSFDEENSSTMIMLLLSMANVFWLLSILFCLAGKSLTTIAFAAFIAIGYPIAIAIWAINERKKQQNN